jgi:choline kinase
LIARTVDDDAIVMDADVLFHQEILRRLVTQMRTRCLAKPSQTGRSAWSGQAGVWALTKKAPHYDYAEKA